MALTLAIKTLQCGFVTSLQRSEVSDMLELNGYKTKHQL